ncbi:MAG: ABC transporter permease subunit [Methanocella sp.]
MSNLLNVAKKEIADIVGNVNVILILVVYLFLILSSALHTYDSVSAGGLSDSELLYKMLGCCASNIIISYGSIIAIMVGFSSISSEKTGNALATLTAKPLYRDTIINGKLLSCTAFMLAVFGLAAALYTAVLLIICGNAISPVIYDYLCRLPFVLAMSAMLALSYMSLSFLFPVLIKNHGVALLSTVITVMMLRVVIPTVSFAGNMEILTRSGDVYNWIIRLCPDTAYWNLTDAGLYDTSISALQVMSNCWTDIADVLLFIIIVLVITYVSFIRRDVI